MSHFIFSQIFCYNNTISPPSPCNPKELFNLRHSLARNVIEWIFGVLKWRFRILQLLPAYNMAIQARIPAALAALHNFIWQYNPEEIRIFKDQPFDFPIDACPESAGELGSGLARSNERARASERRDRIVASMWEQYQHYLASSSTGST